MEETNQEFDSLFISIKNILLQDKNLCNFSRYIDYGKIKTSNADYCWETLPNVLNDNNKANNSQIIRIINKLDTRFFDTLTKLNGSIRDSDYDRYGNRRDSEQLNTIFNINRKFVRDTYGLSVQNICHELCNLMINIDYKFKIKGTSLTPFDFLGKNPLNTNSEKDFFNSYILNNVTKLIFVGDKCFLVAIVDRYHNIYVSAKILQKIWELDSTDDKSEFSKIIVKLFNVFNRCCFYFLNMSITQYFCDMIVSPITAEIYKNYDFKIDDKITLQSMDDFSFSADLETDKYLKENMNQIIRDSVDKYINKKYYWGNIDFKTLIDGIIFKSKQTSKTFAEKAYKNGLKLSNIFSSMGWKYFDVNNKDLIRSFRNLDGTFFRESHIYMYKELNFVPCVAYLYPDRVSRSQNIKVNKHINYRILNEEGKKIISTQNGFIIKTLILDITDGCLICDGNHPNISNGAVCMGDLKGKVTFENTTEEQSKDLIQKCENLLTCINYTSAYRSAGEDLFLNDKYSECYYGFDIKSENNQDIKNNEEQFKNFEDADDMTDFDSNSETSETNSQQNNINSDFEDVESDDFEDVVNE